MAIEIHPESSTDADGVVDAEIIDAEEVGRLERLRTAAAARAALVSSRTKVAFAAQRELVAARLRLWFSTADVTDEHLARDIEARRRRLQEQRDAELRARVQVLRERVRHADPDQTTALAVELAGAETQLHIRSAEAADTFVVNGRDLGRARWGKKAGRLGLVLGGGAAYLNAMAAEPVLALAALGAAPVAWWYLSRPDTGGEGAAGLVPAQSAGEDGPKISLVKEDDAGAGIGGGVVAGFVPDTLAAAGRVSLVKRDVADVRGEQDLVTALVKAGIITEAQRDETHLVGVIEPSGPGWAATVELPRGMEATAAVARVGKLASALRIKGSRIELRTDTSEEGHEGQFRLWVADEENPYGTGKTPSPLATVDSWDFWNDGVPLGSDPRHERHSVALLWSSLLLGGLQGFGKSFLARLIAAAAALDPYVTVHVATGKAGPDWAATKLIARSYVAGNTPSKIYAFLDLLNSLIADMQEIGERLEQLSEEDPARCPEGKLTPELAKEWGIGPTLLLVDELQELLDAAAMLKVKTDDDPESKERGRNGKDVLVETMARFVRVSRYTGGMGLFITQRPDSDSVPTKLRDVCAKRASFRVKGANSSKMVLGEDAVNAGAAPHMLLDSHKGVFVLDSGGVEGHVTLKSDVIELPAFREICIKGRELRKQAGTLTGFAVRQSDVDSETEAKLRLLTDCIAAVTAEGLDRARTERLLELLKKAVPGRYDDVTVEDLGSRLRATPVGATRKIGKVDGQVNANGYTLDRLTEALNALKTGQTP
ncbi:hypothetical protein AB0M94_38885 [Streptomyces xanthochromogenes]|uniref:hypothetical protein n=1 Tax=Streptomyces xanthochromogenes TaxID=67384 RepID=UPI0034296281